MTSGRFTGLDIDLADLRASRKHLSGPYPADWLRHQFVVSSSRHPSLSKLDRWIEKNTTGRWGSYSHTTQEGVTFVVLFELAGDLLRFRGSETDFLDGV